MSTCVMPGDQGQGVAGVSSVSVVTVAPAPPSPEAQQQQSSSPMSMSASASSVQMQVGRSPDPLRFSERRQGQGQGQSNSKSPHSVSDGSLHQKENRERRNGSGGNSLASSPAGSGGGGGSVRPRSLFTSHSFKGLDNMGPFIPINDFSSKYSPRAGSSRDWIQSHFADSPSNMNMDLPYSGGYNRGSGFSPVYFDVDEDPYSPYHWYDPSGMESSTAVGATVTSQGVISLKLHSGIQVDTTIDKGIRVTNTQSQIIISLSPDGNSAALIHPSGLVYAYGSRVEITTTDCNGNTKFAKMFYKGVSFTSDTSALIYLVDQAGTRTTSDTFSDLAGDFSIPVFLHNAHYGSHMMRECTKILRQSQYWITEDGTENWVVNGIRISQTADGLVRVGRGTSKYQIRTSPTNGTASITTPSVHTTASIGVPAPGNSPGPHLFVKRGERRLHSDGLTFIVRNAGHASGFDEFNQLKVY